MKTRRNFLGGMLAAPFLAWSRPKVKIRDIQTMIIQGPRTYTLVKVISDAGPYGVGEAYGNPGAGVREQIEMLRTELIGKDALGIDTIYQGLGQRVDGSAHALMRGVSGIEMALWDLAGKVLDQPVHMLLGGKFRDRVRVYDHASPRNMLDKGSCREWAAKIKEDKAGFTAHKFGPGPHTDPKQDAGRDLSNRLLSSAELRRIRQGWENCREALGFDHDLMVHCHWEFDLRTSIDLADAVESIKPLWLEDPLPPVYTDSWKRLVASSKVPICTGENLAARHGFKDFIINQGCDILHPDLRNTGGFLETKRIADMADVFGLPMATHNTGSIVATLSNIQWAASRVRRSPAKATGWMIWCCTTAQSSKAGSFAFRRSRGSASS
jgi:L-alanine-DL-glutamate epimerase-like enolase superfamily enzyme